MRHKAVAAPADEPVQPISMLNAALAHHLGRPCPVKTRKLVELGIDGAFPIVRHPNGRYGFYPSAVPEIARRLPVNVLLQYADP